MFLRPLLSLCVITQIFAASVAYNISPRAGNEFALEVTKTGLYNGKKHRFVFERYQGTLNSMVTSAKRRQSNSLLKAPVPSVPIHGSMQKISRR